MPEHHGRHRLKGIERPPGHLDHADLQGARQAMLVTISRENRLTFLGGVGKEVADFEVGQLRGDRWRPRNGTRQCCTIRSSHDRMPPQAVDGSRLWC